MRYFLIVIILLWSSILNGHPDGSTPYWYPAGWIYGFVGGCADSLEQNQAPLIEEMWPAQVREVCGCVLDSLRHSITWEEIMDNNSKDSTMQVIVNTTLPICKDEILNKK